MTTDLAVRKSRQVELLISHLLRVGVVTSLLVVVVGSVISFSHHHQYVSSLADLKALTAHDARFPHTLEDAITSARHGEGRGIVVLGLLLLIATPIMRVAVSIFGFVYEGDRIFVAITSAVLGLLMLSLFLGRGG